MATTTSSALLSVSAPCTYARDAARQARVRRVEDSAVYDLAVRLAAKALVTGEWQARCLLGGTVAAAYKYPATTDGVLVVASPEGESVAWRCYLSAKATTEGGIADASLPGSRPLFDARYGATREEAAWKVVRAAHLDAVLTERLFVAVSLPEEVLGEAGSHLVRECLEGVEGSHLVLADWLQENGEADKAQDLRRYVSAGAHLAGILTE